MARCLRCHPPEDMPDDRLLGHLENLHPDVYGDGPMRWPDGRLVVIDPTLDPADFTGPEVPGA